MTVSHDKKIFKLHLEYAFEKLVESLKRQKLPGLVIDSGYPVNRSYDDQYFSHIPNFYFNYFCPDQNPFHFLIIEPGKKIKLYYYETDDFWHEPKSLSNEFWCDEFEIISFTDLNVRQQVISAGQWPVISAHINDFKANQVIIEGHPLLCNLNWSRSFKTDYEVECLVQANRVASQGHIKSFEAFKAGASEFETYLEFLKATSQCEAQLPYGAIIAFNEKSAILHYELKRTQKVKNNVYLIDAGVKHLGYGSDITRTYYSKNVSDEFKNIVDQCHKLQDRLCSLVKGGVDYKDMQYAYQIGVAEILIHEKVLNGDPDTLVKEGVTFHFAPHGLGHPLGLQVHDVTGKVLDSNGTLATKDDRFPYLRTLRSLHAGDVVTIEPGIYFIPALLNKLKTKSESKQVNWSQVEKLLPWGGVRVEDDILVLQNGHRNLTRSFLPF